jgi:hypothetical protein
MPGASCSRRTNRETDEDDVLGALDERKSDELVNLRAEHPGEIEGEAIERLDRRETGDMGEHLALGRCARRVLPGVSAKESFAAALREQRPHSC